MMPKTVDFETSLSPWHLANGLPLALHALHKRHVEGKHISSLLADARGSYKGLELNPLVKHESCGSKVRHVHRHFWRNTTT